MEELLIGGLCRHFQIWWLPLGEHGCGGWMLAALLIFDGLLIKKAWIELWWKLKG
jgi:hypothetical protein